MWQADHGYAVTLRSDDDLVSFSTGISTYTVVSRVAEPEASQLMAAEDDYPDWIQEHYLALPTVPERVQQLASQIVAEAGARTRYEKARAIESYIRATPTTCACRRRPVARMWWTISCSTPSAAIATTPPRP